MIEEKVNILLTKYFRNESTVEEVAELQGYLSDEKLKDSLILRVLGRIEEHEIPKYSNSQFDKESILKEIKDELLFSDIATEEIPVAYTTKSKSLQFLRVAASVCLIAMASWLLYTNLNQTRNQDLVSIDKWKEYETHRGQTRTVSLPDGSEIKLNVSSKIRFQNDFLNGAIRKISLEGEAFFDVAKMPNKPFVVLAKGVETSVLGTSFNIEAYDKDEYLRVAVVTGKVKVSEVEGKDQIYLEPDEMATWGNNSIEKSTYDPGLVLGWTERSLVFKKASFEEVIEELENWYDVDFEIIGNISSDEYDGVHHNESLETLLTGLSFAGNFKYKMEEKKITITAN